jgi:hypothetical protein
MTDVDEYFVNLLAAFVHLRIFKLVFASESDSLIEDGHTFFMKVSDRVPHLEYFTMSHLNRYYKRVGGKLVICDPTECPSFE